MLQMDSEAFLSHKLFYPLQRNRTAQRNIKPTCPFLATIELAPARCPLGLTKEPGKGGRPLLSVRIHIPADVSPPENWRRNHPTTQGCGPISEGVYSISGWRRGI